MRRRIEAIAGKWNAQPEWVRVACIAVALLALYLLVSGSSTLWDRDEPRFARAAAEMAASGDYLVITFNGELRAVKPPLVYWLMALGLQTIGFGEIAVRLWSGLGVALASVGVYGSARRMLGKRTAPWAMVVFGTSLMPLWLATAATADAVTVAWLAAAQWLFIEMVYRGWRGWHMVLMAAALGLTALAKGPMAVLPVISIALSAALLKRMDPSPPKLGARFWAAGVAATLAGLGMFLLWAVPANLATGGELAREGLFNRGFLSRMVEPMQGHGGEGLVGYLLTLPVYLPYLLFDTFPWCLLLPGGFVALLRGRLAGGRERALMWAWTLPTFVIFSLVATKLPHYMLGLMPMMAVALAAVLRHDDPRGEADAETDAEAESGAEAGAGAEASSGAAPTLTRKDRDWVRGGAWFFGGLAAALAGALLIGPWLVKFDGSWRPALIAAATPVGLVAAGLAVWVVRLQLGGRVRRAAGVTLAGFAAIVVLVAVVLLPRIEATVKISPELARTVRERIPADAPVYMGGYEEPSLVYYLDRRHDQPVRSLNGRRRALEEFAAGAGPAALVVSRARWRQLLDGGPTPERLRRVAVMHTLNYSAEAERTDVLVILRRPEGAVDSMPRDAPPAPDAAPGASNRAE